MGLITDLNLSEGKSEHEFPAYESLSGYGFQSPLVTWVDGTCSLRGKFV